MPMGCNNALCGWQSRPAVHKNKAKLNAAVFSVGIEYRRTLVSLAAVVEIFWLKHLISYTFSVILSLSHLKGRLAQLVRAFALHAKCQRFESVIAHHPSLKLRMAGRQECHA